MSDTFNPGLANLARVTGERVHRADYSGSKAKQHKQSIDLMIAKIREGYKDRRIRARVGEVLHAAGLDGRDPNVTDRQRAQALLDYLRAGTVYVPDPVKTEYIVGAAATLCLSPDLCIRASDCDDGTVALVCLLLSAGIPTWIVVETFGSNPMTGVPYQGHVLVGCKDEQGNAFACDPSTMKPVGGFSEHATQRQWIDPLRDSPTEIIGVGRAHGGHGLGAAGGTIPATASGVQIPGQWTTSAGNAVTAGIRYAVGVTVAPTLAWTAADVTSYFSPPSIAANLGAGAVSTQTTAGPQFLVEQVIPGSTTTSWIMIGVARTGGVVATDATVTVVAVLQEQSPATTTPSQNTSSLVVPPQTSSMNFGAALACGAGVALVAGVGWHLWKRGYFK